VTTGTQSTNCAEPVGSVPAAGSGSIAGRRDDGDGDRARAEELGGGTATPESLQQRPVMGPDDEENSVAGLTEEGAAGISFDCDHVVWGKVVSAASQCSLQ